ncbi:MAG: hypothetical protein LBI59_09175 [Candidatus Accumulibacter sp.]|jgi:hypothetical protein|nr:hypothetical protein [Accumulibacter sp.]
MSGFFHILRRGRRLLPALLAVMLSLPALAQSDPPGRIGRVAWISGDVYLTDPETGGFSAAPLNQPLTSGDVVTTGSGARAEIQIGAMTLRIDVYSQVVFRRIDDAQVAVALAGGRIIVKLPTEEILRDFALDAGNGRFLPRTTGVYRFDRDDAGIVTATVYFGALRFEGRDTAFDVAAGESVRVWNDDAGRTEYRMAAGVNDEFTQWSAARDQQEAALIPSIHVSPEMTGAPDLEAWGNWEVTQEYGAVWFPRGVGSAWAPYRQGHWTWIPPWGWTWIGREPWGFAPFHYGRWARIRGAWCWVPGARIARPVYAPAIVGWLGAPGGVSIGIAASAPVVWFPLAPREVFAPRYRASPAHIRRLNAPLGRHLANAERIASHPREFARNQNFVHRRDPNALNVTQGDAFSRPRRGIRIAPESGNNAQSARTVRSSADSRAMGTRRAQSADAPPPSRNRPPPQDFRRREAPRSGPSPDRTSAPMRRDQPQTGAPRTETRAGTATSRGTSNFGPSRQRREEARRAPTPTPAPGTASASVRRDQPRAGASRTDTSAGTAAPRQTFGSSAAPRRTSAAPRAFSSSSSRPSKSVTERPRERPRASQHSSQRRSEAGGNSQQRNERRGSGRRSGR